MAVHDGRRPYQGPQTIPFDLGGRKKITGPHNQASVLESRPCSVREAGGVLCNLNGREVDPFTGRPDMIGQSGSHRGRPLPTPALVISLPQRANHPAEVVAV